MELIKAERNTKEHYTRLTLADGSHEDFATIRGGIAFPFKKTPGLILIGGVRRESEAVKILVEREFASLGDVVSIYLDLEKQFLVYEFYYQDAPENEAFAEYLRRKTNWDAMVWPAPHSEDFTYGVALINEYLEMDRLSVPKNGVIENQLATTWEGINADNRPYGLIALACLLAGFEGDNRDGEFISEFNIESCLF